MPPSGKATKPCPLCQTQNFIDATRCVNCGAHLRRKTGALPENTPIPMPPVVAPAFPPPPSGMRNLGPVQPPPNAFMRDPPNAPPETDMRGLGRTGQTAAGRTENRGGPVIPPPFPGGSVPPRFPGDPGTGEAQAPGVPLDSEEARARLKARYERPRPAPLVIPRRNLGPVIVFYSLSFSVVFLVLYAIYHHFSAVAYLTVDNGMRGTLSVVVDDMTPVSLQSRTATKMGFEAYPRKLQIFDPQGHVLADQVVAIDKPRMFHTNDDNRYIYNIGGANYYNIYTVTADDRIVDAVPVGNQVFFKNPAMFGPGEFIKNKGVYVEGNTKVLGHFPIHEKGQCCAWLRQFRGVEKWKEQPLTP